MRRTVVVLSLCAGLGPQAAADDWPRWRGARFDGVAAAAPAALSQPFELRVRWKKDLGSGYAAVVVAEGLAVTLFSDGQRDFVGALDADTGEERWRFALGPTFEGRDGATDGGCSTPAIDRGVVYALGPRGDLVAVALDSGRLLWKRQVADELQAVVPYWGFTTSPLVTADAVVVLTGGAGAFTAFDRRDGRTLWRAGEDEASYQSPMLVTVDGREAILGAGDTTLFALDPASGRVLWQRKHEGTGFFQRIVNPLLIGGDSAVLTNQRDQAVRLPLRADGEALWKAPGLRANYATPVAVGGLVFGFDGDFLSCVDAGSGKQLWKSRPPGNGFPIVVGDRVAVLTKAGSLHVAEAAADGYRERARLKLFERQVWTPPSFARGRFYARDSFATVAAVDVVATAAGSAAAASEARGTLPHTAFARWVLETERAAEPGVRAAQWLAAQPRFPIVEGDDVVHFVWQGEGDVALRSDLSEIGDDVALHAIAGTDLRYASFRVPADARIGYQFVSAAGGTVADPRNPAKTPSIVRAGPVSLLTMPKAAPLPVGGTAGLRGRIEELPFETPQSRVGHGRQWGGPRKVKVYLPPGYDAEPQRRYPAVYVLYGEEMLEAGAASALDRAITAGQAPVVAVFVEATSGYEYACSQRDLHSRMLALQLVPAVDARYRTSSEPAQRGVVGAIEGGQAAAEIGLGFPQVFGRAGVQSLFPVGAAADQLLERIAREPRSTTRFVLDWGSLDARSAVTRSSIPDAHARLRDALRRRGDDVVVREHADGSDLPMLAARLPDVVTALFR